MNTSFSFLTLKDEFYDEYKIPHLLFPLKTEVLVDSVKEGGLPIPLMVDNLLAFLEEEPGEMETYEFTLMKLSYYAGTWEMQNKNFEAAYKYLKVAQKHGFIKNVSINYSLALACLALKKNEEAREITFLSYAFTKHTEFIPEIWMLLVICEYLVGNVDASIKLIHEFFAVGNKRYPTSHAALHQDLSFFVYGWCKGYRIQRVMDKYNTPDYPGNLGDQE